MGGVDAPLAGAPAMVPTPLAPNLYRTDFATGKDKFVFWQFTPLNVTVVLADGSKQSLCAEGDVASDKACTVIADTGYGSNVVGDDAARKKIQDATDPGAASCAKALEVYLPTQKGGVAPEKLTIPLTVGESGSCTDLTMPSGDWVKAPEKLKPNLPKNWFVWGQPMLRQLYVAFSFKAYRTGALYFAPRAG
jgi:hypothetical protein